MYVCGARGWGHCGIPAPKKLMLGAMGNRSAPADGAEITCLLQTVVRQVPCHIPVPY